MNNNWLVNSPLLQLKEVEYRNKFAEKLSKQTVQEITKSYTYLNFDEVENILRLIQTYMKTPFHGVGIELGAGTGLFSTVLASLNKVKKMYALEIVPGMAEMIIPKVADAHLTKSDRDKLLPVIGSFDNIQLPDESLDFAFEYDSFHHSSNLFTSFQEIYRKLKKGGFFVLLDRCHPNSLSDVEVEAMVKKIYSKDFLLQNGYPIDMTLTRAENGEHEYRLREWCSAIENAGFKQQKYGKFYPKVKSKQVYWYILSILKGKKNKSINSNKNILAIYLCQKTGISFGDYHTVKPLKETLHKEATLFILQKQ